MAKIAVVISSLYSCGGEERVVSLIANELVKHHDVTIFTFENREKEGNSKNDYYLSEKINVERVYHTGSSKWRTLVKILYFRTGMTGGVLSSKLLKDAFYPKVLLKEWTHRINKGRYDLVIAVSGVNTMLIGYIRERISARTVCWEHSSYEGYFDPQRGYYRNRIDSYRECASKMDARVVLNRDIKKKYMENLGLETVVIHNPKSFTSTQKADMAKKCFVTCGRVEAEKAYDDMIEAFADFSKYRDDWKLLIIGGGSLHKKCEETAARCGVSEGVTITGYTHEVEAYLLQGSVFVMTSRWEGFPMSVTEALELGLPVISYSIPAMEPLVTDGVEGKIVPAFDRNSLVEAMKELAENEDLRIQMSENAIAKARKFEPEQIVQEWLKLFDDLEVV